MEYGTKYKNKLGKIAESACIHFLMNYNQLVNGTNSKTKDRKGIVPKEDVWINLLHLSKRC
jgi:hypothetical protein